MAGSKSTQIKIRRDNHIHYTSLRLLFLIIMRLFMSTCSCYPSVSVLDLHAGENIPYMARDIFDSVVLLCIPCI